MKQEYLTLAHVYKNQNIGGWFVSEKLDGTRAFWDGGISRGCAVEAVPYANSIKDSRYLTKQVATGLWSRSGKIIHAPDWWLDTLPNTMLDGELFIGYGQFQKLRKIISCLNSDYDWNIVNFMAFDIPTMTVFDDREIKIRNDYSFFIKDARPWTESRGVNPAKEDWPFELRYIAMKNRCVNSRFVTVVEQERLPLSDSLAKEELDKKLDYFLERGGEGCMVRWGAAKYVTERTHHLLKYKPWFTAEGKVIGYISGEYGKTGRLHGMVGALVVVYDGKILKLSGLTDAQRLIENEPARKQAMDYPGLEINNYNHPEFPLNSLVEFKYRELSDDGIPKEARFWRKRDED